MKNPTIATVLNIIPGLGYLYIGGTRNTFGTLLLVGVAFAIVSSFDPLYSSEEYLNATLNRWGVAALLSTLAFVAGFMYDAYTCALEYNKGLQTGKE